jgi:hypothetical protein
MFDRLLEPSQLMEQDRALIGRFPVTRIERQDVLKAQQRIRGTLQRQQDVAEVFPQFGDIRLELHRLVEGLERLLEPPLALQGASEGDEIFWLGRLLQRARNPLDGMIVLLGVERQHAHQIQAVGVI